MEGVGSHGPQEAEAGIGPLVEEATRERLREPPDAARRRVLLTPDVVRGEGEGCQVPQGARLGGGRPEDGLLDDGCHDVRTKVEAGGALPGTFGEALHEPEGRADEEGIHDPQPTPGRLGAHARMDTQGML